MTREEKIELLNRLLEIEEKNDIGNLTRAERGEFQQWVNALEQEPFINKPCVSSGVCEHDKQKVLDRIRAEIEQMDFDFGDFYDHTSTIREMVLEVIDKYKLESEW